METDNKKKLAQAVANEVSLNGWRVAMQSDDRVVLEKGKQINNVLHVILDVITGGVWLLVHVPLWAINRRQVKVLSIDEFGNILNENQ